MVAVPNRHRLDTSCSGGSRRLSCSSLHPIAEEAEACAICLASLCSEEAELDCRLRVTVLSCDHQFHHECIGRWVSLFRDPNRKPTCPLCRTADLEQLQLGSAQSRGLLPAADRDAECWLEADWTVPLEECCPSPRRVGPPPAEASQSQEASARSVMTTVFGSMQPFWSVHEGWRQMQGALDALRQTLTSHGWTTPETPPPVGSPPPPDDSPPPPHRDEQEDVDIFHLDLEQ